MKGSEQEFKTALAAEEDSHDIERGREPQNEKRAEDPKTAKGKDGPPAVKRSLAPKTGCAACPGKDSPAPACNTGVAGALTLLSKHPQLLIAPAILFCLIVALCSFGIVHATNASYNLEGEQAKDEATSAADGLVVQLSSASRAVLSLAAVVKMNPNWSFLESNFLVLAEELFRQSNEDGNLALRELALLPFGRVRLLLTKPDQRNSTADLFSPALVDRLQPYQSIAVGGLTINGPIPLTTGDERAFAARYPIFFSDVDEDEDWGHPDNITHPTDCPGPPCYNPETGEKFWGFIGAVVNAEPLLAGDNVHLKRLLSDGLSYSLTTSALAGTNGPGILVSGGPNPDKVTANVTVALPGNSWALSVYNPRQDEILTLRNGLIAMVVVMAFILSVLLLLLLLSAKRASVLLQEQLITNKLLQEEKVSREALLGRQFDLIACFEQNTKRYKNISRSNLSSDGQLNTLDRIAAARAAISDVRRSKDEDINVLELLAEGSFGKVYRGQWRGTDVAVKIIMLPGNMSGREKREKMVVWEAAISSSLIHPNICQTYHYRIKPVKESARPGLGMDDLGSAVVFSDMSGSRQRSGCYTDSRETSRDKSSCSGPEEVHSYEVHLVLEYCDRSSLRDALDAGVFMTPNGLNYAAQLDCAMDVAKAMLHLHCNNVLHLDLKTRNVLLSSTGAEGRGVMCKVSDFGLSVRMENMETHVSSLFQGTLTHMAPEVLLKGTCSKASDVYAFGIVLWELFTCGSPFRGVPPALLGHLIVKELKRPDWPPVVPSGYKDLVEACWDQDPDARPTFEEILQRLTALRNELGTPTPPLQPISLLRPQRGQPHLQNRTSPQGQEELSLVQLRSIDSRDFLHLKGPSTPSQAGCPAYQGSFGPMAEEADKSHRAGCLQEEAGQRKPMHPGSGAWDRGDGWAGEPSMPNRSIHTSLTRSANSAPLAQLPMKSPGSLFQPSCQLPSIHEDHDAQHHLSSPDGS